MLAFDLTAPLRRARLAVLTLGAVAALGACGDDDDGDDLTGPGASVSAGRTIFGIDAANNLVAFGAQNPTTTAARRVPITGLGTGETVVGIDFRSAAAAAADRRLYGATSASRIVTIDTTTGAASVVGTTALTPALTGTAFGFDFNPTTNPAAIRVHSDQDQDLRINALTGATAGVDSVLAYAIGDPNVGQNPNVVGTAYTNSVAGVTTTELFAIDSDRDALVVLATPNTGRLTTRGLLGVKTSPEVGFDIYGPGLATAVTAQAYASLTLEGQTRSKLYAISLSSGQATFIGDINYNRPLIGISITP